MIVSLQDIVNVMFCVYFYDFNNDTYTTDPLNSIGMLILITCKSRNSELIIVRPSETCLLWDYGSIYHELSQSATNVVLQQFSESGWDVPRIEPEIFYNVNDLVKWAKQNMLLELL